MRPVSSISGRAYPWGAKNVDTDMIIPARWLKTTTRHGLREGAFESIRQEPGNIFDDPRFTDAPILIAGENFGCGSSREHAVWALAEMGVEAIVAPSFSDIFAVNAIKNGIVTVRLPGTAVARLIEAAQDGEVTVDLGSMTVATSSGEEFRFELDPFRRDCLIKGLDEISLTLDRAAAISVYEERVAASRPWALLPGAETADPPDTQPG